VRKMNIGTVLFDQAKGAAIVTLTEEDGERTLSIYIGIPEGMTVFRELNRTPNQRPLLHDLIQNLLQGLHTRLEKVLVDSMSDTTYYARLYLRHHDTMVVMDARPSDAVALAVKLQAPIYVAEAVLQAVGKRGDFTVPAADPRQPPGEEPSSDDVRSWLENIRPEDFADPK
jgi:bifunctional DNase/RNase